MANKTSDNKATMQELMAQWRMRMASSLNLESEPQISVEELLSCSQHFGYGFNLVTLFFYSHL